MDEYISFAEDIYFKNGQDIDKVREALLKNGLQETKVEEVIEKFSEIKSEKVAVFEDALASGAIQSIKFEANPDHKPGTVGSDQVDRYIAYGSYQIERQEYENAVEMLNKALELDSHAVLAYANLATVYSETGDHQIALQYWDKAISLQPNDSRFYSNKALLLENMDKVSEAISCYRQAVQIDSKNTNALNNLGSLLIQEGNHADAIKNFKLLLATDPNDQDAKYNLLTALAETNTQEALAYYRQQPSASDVEDIDYVIPAVLLRHHKNDDAEEFFNHHFKTTSNPKFLKIKAQLYQNRNNALSLATVKAYLELKPSDITALNLKMNLLCELTTDADDTEFLKSIDAVLAIDQNDPNALGYKIQYLLIKKELTDAIRLVNKLFTDHHSERYVIGLLLGVYSAIEDKHSALREFEQFAKKLSDGALYQLGYVKGLYFKGKMDYQSAVDVFTRLNTEQHFAWNYYQIAIIENLRGNTEACLRNLKRTFELDPSLKLDARNYEELENLKGNSEFIMMTN